MGARRRPSRCWPGLLLGAALLLAGGCQGMMASEDPTIHVGETTSLACADCHTPDYTKTTAPTHNAMGFPTTCEACHVKASWSPAVYDHGVWPLVGGHDKATCGSCHGAAAAWVGKPDKACKACHLSDYNATTAPKHTAAGYSTTCEGCHTPKGWIPASFDHSTWPLVGKHQGVSCASCHGSGVQRTDNPPTVCKGCHLSDYQGTTNPKHSAAGYPQACEGCHTPKGWVPATGITNHAFPITSGKHKNVACATCHTNSSDYKVFTCMSSGCHPKGQTDGDHVGEVNGYSYDAKACYSCHPDGKE